MKIRRIITILMISFVALALLVSCNEQNPPHAHDLSHGYESDEADHWLLCSGCNEKIDLGTHTWSEVVTSDDEGGSVASCYCTVCGYRKVIKNDEGDAKPVSAQFYWGVSVYSFDFLTKYVLGDDGKVSEAYHYELNTFGDRDTSKLCEAMKDVYVYDESGRLEFVEFYGINEGESAMLGKYGLTYNSLGEIDKIFYYDAGYDQPDENNYLTCTYESGKLSRVISTEDGLSLIIKIEGGKISGVSNGSGTSEWDAYQISYNTEGNILMLTDVMDDVVCTKRFEYNSDNMPISFEYKEGGAVLYTMTLVYEN